MNKLLTIIISLGIITTLLNLSVRYKPAFAYLPGSHSHYLHAMSDLRKADQLLDVSYEPNVTHKLREAGHQDRRAIHDIDVALILDGKNLKETSIGGCFLKGRREMA